MNLVSVKKKVITVTFRFRKSKRLKIIMNYFKNQLHL